MAITAQLHDGRQLEFPDGTDPAVIQATVKKVLGTVEPPAEKSFPQQVGQQVMNAGAGALRGAGSIGATLLTPYDLIAGNTSSIGNTERRNAMDEALSSLGADTNSLAYQGGKLGGEIAGTAGVGGALASGLRAIPAVARVAPGVISAIESAGFSGPNMLARMGGGALTGGATAGLVDPSQAGTGALIGGALPPVAKGAGWAGEKIGSGVTKLLQNVFGMTTGVGPEPIKQAFKAGMSGNQDFTDNLAGNVPLTDVLDRAKQGLQTMAAAKSAQYKAGMIPVANDSTQLSFTGIDKALQDAGAIIGYKGQIKDETAAKAVETMRGMVDDWKNLDQAQFHTPEGMDALKQKLGSVLESIPYQQKTARLAAGKVYNAAKAEIVQQAPVYADVMKDYSAAAEQITEIERALSLNKGAAKDTAMRKLQSLMRNNVQTNYGNRLTLANTLEDKGGVDLMPSLAGQALNSWTPRSLAGQLGSGTVAAGGLLLHNPLAIPLLAMQSPRLVGNAAYGAGKLGGLTQNMLQNPSAIEQFGYRAAPVLATGQ